MARKGIRNLTRFVTDLLDFPSIADDFIDAEKKKGKIVRALVESAMRGIGRNGKPYTPYKPNKKTGETSAYEKKKKKAGGNKGRWMWGMGSGPHMLSRSHFMWRVAGKGVLELVWEGTGKTGDYAEAHNEGLGNMPKREWMHLEAPKTEQAVDDTLAGVIENRAKKFSRKWGR